MDKKQEDYIREFILPTTATALFYLVSSLALILVAKLDAVLKTFSTQNGLGETLGRLISKTNDYTTISGSLLWFLVGAVIYILLWAAIVIIIDGYNNILVSTAFIHPKSFHQSDYWAAIAGRALIRASAWLLILGGLVFGTGALISYGYSKSVEGWADNSILDALGIFGMVLLTGFVGMHTFTLLLRLALMRKRVY